MKTDVAKCRIARRCLLAGAAVLAVAPIAGCMAEAMCAIPCALEEAAILVARAVPLDESKYIADAPIRGRAQPALAQAPESSPKGASRGANQTGSGRTAPAAGTVPQPVSTPTIITATACAGAPPT